MLTHHTRSLLLLIFVSLLSVCPMHASASTPDNDGWLSDLQYLPSAFRVGSGFACSIGATAAFVASAYILAKHYQASTLATTSTQKKSYLPPREFWWSITTGAAFIAALYVLTATSWSKQI